MKPTIKPRQATTFHRDATVSLWDVHKGQWRRLPVTSVTDQTLATLPEVERNRIRIRAARAAKGWTVGEMAEVCGVSPRTVENWEQGRTPPSAPALLALRAALRHSVGI